jgi:hypothetical protein
MLTPKELKKLAKACREAGIKTFKQGDIEFTLSDDLSPPESPYMRKKAAQETKMSDPDIETDGPTEEELLFWSSGTPDGDMELRSE